MQHCLEIRPWLRRFVALPTEGNGRYACLAAARGMDGRMQVIGMRKTEKEWYVDRSTELNAGEDVRYDKFAQMCSVGRAIPAGAICFGAEADERAPSKRGWPRPAMRNLVSGG